MKVAKNGMGLFVVLLALGLSACGVTADPEQSKDDGAGKIAAVSTDLQETSISPSDLVCPAEYSFRSNRTPTAAQSSTVAGIIDVSHNCFSRTNRQIYCRIIGQEHYLVGGAQRNYLSSDTCGSYGLFNANRDNNGQPVCISGCEN